MTFTSIEQSIFNNFPGYWGAKDHHSVYRYVNHRFANLLGFKHNDDIIGRHYVDIMGTQARCAKEYRYQDDLVIELGQELSVLDIHPYPDNQWRVHLYQKKPWRDAQGNIQGILFFGQEMTNTALLEVGHWICSGGRLDHAFKRDLRAGTKAEKPSLTLREEEVLFMLLYGQKPQKIANMMGISVKTVEGYVIRLRAKFAANSKQELLVKALQHGMGSHIPQTLLRTQLSIILRGAEETVTERL